MASANAFHGHHTMHAGAATEPHAASSAHHPRARTRLPVIPDLRFEHSYVRSVRAYIDVVRDDGDEDVQGTDAALVGQALRQQGYEELDASLGAEKEKLADNVTTLQPKPPLEVIRVQWKKVLWVTLRDQVISPFLQGTLWALASYYLTPFSAQLGSRMGTFVHHKLPTKEGSGVTWLRSWAKNIGFSNGDGRSSGQPPPRPSNLRY